VSILARVDEATYDGGAMGSPHPIAWYHEFDGGRAWYTAMGHTSESYAEPAFAEHLAGGILWAVTR
jgi:type 1 glutamine amidotransferase